MSVVLHPPQQKRVHRAVLLDSTLDMQSDVSRPRCRPNILITGTPGTGKTTHAELVAAETGLLHINVGHIVKQHDLHDGYSEELDTYWLNEDKVNDYLEGPMAEGGVIVDHHSCSFFPERFFDLVVVLHADTMALYDRLAARGYQKPKIEENVQCEIFCVVKQEADASYGADIVQHRSSNDPDEMEANVEAIVAWCTQYASAENHSS